jgi:DNA-directed RNA polymerase specialized sigma24 family protein
MNAAIPEDIHAPDLKILEPFSGALRAFLHAYQSLHSFKGDSLCFTWLYRTAVNTAISMKRKQRCVLRIQHARRFFQEERCDEKKSPST